MPKSESELLTKDAVYNAVGMGCFYLSKRLDFKSWFLEKLVPEIQQQSMTSISSHIVLFTLQWEDSCSSCYLDCW